MATPRFDTDTKGGVLAGAAALGDAFSRVLEKKRLEEIARAESESERAMKLAILDQATRKALGDYAPIQMRTVPREGGVFRPTREEAYTRPGEATAKAKWKVHFEGGKVFKINEDTGDVEDTGQTYPVKAAGGGTVTPTIDLEADFEKRKTDINKEKTEAAKNLERRPDLDRQSQALSAILTAARMRPKLERQAFLAQADSDIKSIHEETATLEEAIAKRRELMAKYAGNVNMTKAVELIFRNKAEYFRGTRSDAEWNAELNKAFGKSFAAPKAPTKEPTWTPRALRRKGGTGKLTKPIPTKEKYDAALASGDFEEVK